MLKGFLLTSVSVMVQNHLFLLIFFFFSPIENSHALLMRLNVAQSIERCKNVIPAFHLSCGAGQDIVTTCHGDSSVNTGNTDARAVEWTNFK